MIATLFLYFVGHETFRSLIKTNSGRKFERNILIKKTVSTISIGLT